jgi:hypothetical protein
VKSVREVTSSSQIKFCMRTRRSVRFEYDIVFSTPEFDKLLS